MLPSDLIKNVLALKLDINAISITLTQCVKDNPVVFRGAGKITQDSDGNLLLHMIHVNTEDIPFPHFSFNVKDLPPGTIVPDDYFFDMNAVDTYGFVWVAKRLDLDNHYFFDTNSIVIKSHIYSLTRRQYRMEAKDTGWLEFVIPYSVALSCNKSEAYGNGGKRRSILCATISDAEVTVNNAEGKLIITATARKEIDMERLAHAILSGFSIIVGVQLEPVLKQMGIDTIFSTEIKSLKKMSRAQLERPFESTAPFHYSKTVNFLDKYVSAFLDAPTRMTELYGYWHKVFMAHDASLELWALALTTSIEGVFKNHFSEMLKKEDSFEEKLKDAREKLTETDIDQEVLQKLCGSLSNFNKKSIKAGLETYVADKPPYANWPSVWNDLRNKSTHADILDESVEKAQRYWNQTFTCQAIFYHLIASAIGYDGNLIAYSMAGWPELSKDEEKLNQLNHI